MTKKDKKEIMSILEYYESLIGIDKSKIANLKKQVNLIRTIDPNETVDEQIWNDIIYWANVLDYKLDKETNLNRDQTLVAKRDVIVYLVQDRFYFYGLVDYILAEALNKDRTSIMAATKRAKERMESKDYLFMDAYELTQRIAV